MITKNGLWIKDSVKENIYIINALKINDEFLIDTFITEFNNKYEVIKNIQSKKVDISNNQWIAHDVKIFKNNEVKKKNI